MVLCVCVFCFVLFWAGSQRLYDKFEGIPFRPFEPLKDIGSMVSMVRWFKATSSVHPHLLYDE